MPEYRSRTTTHGRNMAGARALWRATGMKDGDFDKPIIAIANSFTQFVPGHVHLKDMGQLVAREVEKAGGVAKEFNTIAVDDGIAMGHAGMLYSLPSRELIADAVEYMVTADNNSSISSCDKISAILYPNYILFFIYIYFKHNILLFHQQCSLQAKLCQQDYFLQQP